MTSHCSDCGSRVCGHDNCPQCNPCEHCNGGDREDKFYGYEFDENGNGSEREYPRSPRRW